MRSSHWILIFVMGLSGPGPNRGETSVYHGMSDASAAAPLDDARFVVADDEDNILRIFDRARPGMPVATLDLTDFLGVGGKGGESDIEGAVRIGDRIYWITSHGRNAKGKERRSRQRFFATRIVEAPEGATLMPFGKPYARLLGDLLNEPRLARFDLAAAAQKAPKQSGGFNIEGLAALPDGRLLIGFRNPVPEGKALLVPLVNPAAVIDGATARFDDPILLDLGGLGIRAITFHEGRHVLIAGPFDGGDPLLLYIWRGGDHRPEQVKDVDLTGFKAEAILMGGDSDSPYCDLISDDGSHLVDGVEAKRLKDPALKSFRMRRVGLPSK